MSLCIRVQKALLVLKVEGAEGSKDMYRLVVFVVEEAKLRSKRVRDSRDAFALKGGCDRALKNPVAFRFRDLSPENHGGKVLKLAVDDGVWAGERESDGESVGR